MTGGWQARLVRRWVDIYTRGLPDDARNDRRDEIDSDLWSQLEEARVVGRSDRSTNSEILVRLLFGLPADVTWRLSHQAASADLPPRDRIVTNGFRTTGMFAIVGGVFMAILFISVVVAVEVLRPQNPWTDFGWGVTLLALGLIAQLSLAAATIGLVFQFQDRIHGAAAFTGSIGAMAGMLAAFGAYQLTGFLPLGSAILIGNLAATGVLDRRAGVAYVLSVVLFVVVVLRVPASGQIDIGILLALPYALAWIPIGVSLIRGVRAPKPAPDAPAEPREP
jgi:hypothetical protein